MKTQVKLLIVAALAVAVIAAVALKQKGTNESGPGGTTPPQTVQAPSASQTPDASGVSTAAPPATIPKKLPKLLDLGADKCIPCRMMAPVLEELKREYAGRLEVEFIDVWKNPDAGRRYGIQMIPTQIFYDAEGRERARHVGFIAKEDILAKFRELGVDLGGEAASGKPAQ
ncbi:thioredoxin family protein [Limisphaera sp. 4302-co]|uniref:thioredoxin family protein n=1 Tax=Limisphaera sp. 4302-co TaxID=3400417 RepID=UPI003C270A4C